MNESSDKLSPQYQQLVDAGVSGIDVMHGMLKIDMLEAKEVVWLNIQIR